MHVTGMGLVTGLKKHSMSPQNQFCQNNYRYTYAQTTI